MQNFILYKIKINNIHDVVKFTRLQHEKEKEWRSSTYFLHLPFVFVDGAVVLKLLKVWYLLLGF